MMESHNKKSKGAYVAPKYWRRFVGRFSVISLVSFLLLGLILRKSLTRPLGMNYLQDILTLSNLQEQLPAILLQTGVIQAGSFSLLLLMVTLFWAQKVSGPVTRFRRWLSALQRAETIENVEFRAKDQLHELAVAFRYLQASHKHRNRLLGEDLKAAEALLAEYEELLAKGHGSLEALEKKRAHLQDCYAAAKNRFLEKHIR